MTYRPGCKAISEALETHEPQEVADALGVHVSHVYNIDRRGVSPTLYEALVDAGWVDPPAKVYTLAFRFRSRAYFEAARAAVDAHPGGRSEWLMEQVQEVS